MDRESLVRKAVKEFGTKYGEHIPVDVDRDGDVLLFSWRKNNSVVFESESIQKSVWDFRYVVVLRDDETFYGYDTDVWSYNMDRRKRMSSTEHSGRGYNCIREFGVDKSKKDAATNLYEFSAHELHDSVMEFITDCGWEYREQRFEPTDAELIRTNYKLVGTLLSAFGLFGIKLFNTLQLGILILIPILFLMIGLCALCVGLAIFKPVEFTPLFMCLVISEFIFIGTTIVLGVTEYLLQGIVPAETMVMFHGVDIMCLVGAVFTYIAYKLLKRKYK